MTVETTTLAMTWEDYERLGDDTRGEYYGGQLVVSAAPSQPHQDIVYELTAALKAARRPGERVTAGWGWSPAQAREELIPDVMVHTSAEPKRLTTVPLLVVEVVSSDRRADLVAKLFRYAQWGAPTYWVIDQRDQELVVHELRGDLYAVAAVHTDGVVDVAYADHHASVDIDALFDPAD